MTAMEEQRSGIVLAGGGARRFGADKLAAEIGGRSLLHRAIDAVATVTSEVIVVVSPDAMPSLPTDVAVPLRIARDARPAGGPLVGLLAGLEAAGGMTAIVVGGDMPSLVPAVLDALAARATDRRASALVDGSTVRSLPCAMPRIRGLEMARDLLANGRSSLRDLLGALDVDVFPEAEWRRFDPAGDSLVDIDRPEDLVSRRGER